MASIAFQPGTAPIEALTGSPGQQPAPGAPTTNPNQAQNAPAPQDTVVLTGKISESGLNGENPNGTQYQEAAVFFSMREMFIGQGNAPTGAPQPPAETAPQTEAPETQTAAVQASAQAAPTNPSDPAIAAAVAANAQSGGTAADPAGAGPTTPQQQLQQLDQTLQQLGINPQSITLFNRMAMLLYANDPAALRVMVQEIQGAGQQGGATGANSASGNQQAAQMQAQAQALLQSSGQAPPANPPQPQAQTQAAAPAPVQDQNANFAGGAPSELAIAQFTFNETQAAVQENGAANQGGQANQPAAYNANGAPTTNAASNDVTVQFVRLQFTFSEIATQESQPAGQNGASNSTGQGQTLNVTA
jgi:hypothetical protein